MLTQLSDTHPKVENVQIQLLHKAGLVKRISLLRSLSHTVVCLARNAISRVNHTLSEQEINLIFIANNYGNDIARKLQSATTPVMKNFDFLAALKPLVKAFNETGIDYYIGGSIASSAYGIPRSTLDIDIAADLQLKHAAKLVSRLKGSYYIESEMVSDAIQRQSSFNIIHLETMLKVDIFIVKDTPFDREAFCRKKQEVLDEDNESDRFYLASAEDIILYKLVWYRLGEGVSERQWRDLVGVIKVQNIKLDKEYLRFWASELEISDLLEQAFIEGATG